MQKDKISGIIIATLLLITLVIIIFPQLLTSVDPLWQDFTNRLQPPGTKSPEDYTHWFGTDRLGRDVFSRTIHGARASLSISFVAATIAGFIGSFFGMIAAFKRGIIASIITRAVDVQHSIPLLIVALAVIAVLEPTWGLLVFFLILWGWVPFVRVAWGSTLSIMEKEFITAATTSGVKMPSILIRHVLPNILHSLIIVWSFQIAYLIIVESSLSFLGIGIQPPTPSLGRMVRDASTMIERAYWVAIYPGGTLVALVLLINLIGDWLRDRYR